MFGSAAGFSPGLLRLQFSRRLDLLFDAVFTGGANALLRCRTLPVGALVSLGPTLPLTCIYGERDIKFDNRL
ncbi:hypothetical protein KIN_01330 [Litoreibacter roseus]|uniref:Uncharacterized protein n=1 Tax=Litoreibacter roseus TaxID=2601869 RepID=A0A6N6JCC3_9RHOB|nr:hypothetical protein KIN_01330 [Litoreibacter roseus]